MEPFIAQIMAFGGNFAPRFWADCNGQLLPISSNTALFSLIGTIYGGDGRTTFALPDLRGRVPMHYGNGPGLSPRTQGQKIGFENITLSVANLPAHGHNILAAEEASLDAPDNAFIAASGVPSFATTGNTTLNSASVTNTGGNVPIQIIQPSLVIRYVIALVGIFPSRN